MMKVITYLTISLLLVVGQSVCSETLSDMPPDVPEFDLYDLKEFAGEQKGA